MAAGLPGAQDQPERSAASTDKLIVKKDQPEQSAASTDKLIAKKAPPLRRQTVRMHSGHLKHN